MLPAAGRKFFLSFCYKNFIGIDIGKFSFVVAVYNANETNEYENSASGIAKFLDEYQIQLIDALCILETTGGYEMELLLTLCHKQVECVMHTLIY